MRNVCGQYLVDVKGFDSTIGFTQWAKNPAERDAAVRFPLLFPFRSRLISHLPSLHIRHLPPPNNRSS
jgi:hypothetical protein